MILQGLRSAFITMSHPKRSSSEGRVCLKAGSSSLRCSSAAPPPGTMPSSTAANVAFLASSIRSLRSSNSASVAAPTLMTATPPDSLAMRSLSFSVSYTLSVSDSSFLSWAMRISISSLEALSAMRVVEVEPTVALRAMPSCSTTVLSTFMPRSLAMNSAPVTMAMSCSKALRRSPKPGALIAHTLSTPRSLLTTRVARASPETSSAMMSRGALRRVTCSRMGTMSRMLSIFWSVTSTRTLSYSARRRSWLVTNWGLM
mmetsp:Transcript_19382/g.33481  ORF Transcript_19382/g.33481 Transcript_19382/m.33481 type:complete len:258 (+) Transcript_19382:692-1465(+)